MGAWLGEKVITQRTVGARWWRIGRRRLDEGGESIYDVMFQNFFVKPGAPFHTELKM
jgi:hypothetical protein